MFHTALYAVPTIHAVCMYLCMQCIRKTQIYLTKFEHHKVFQIEFGSLNIFRI